MTEVVAALIWDQGKFMICQRPAHKARGLLWEFVGGKVEPGETKEQALIRECREELAVTLDVGEVFMDVTHEYPDLTLAEMLSEVKGKKVYGYLKKPVKAQVDAIVDELGKLPQVAECYDHWNRMRDELERYYKDTPREHKPLSQQQEFKAIKNMVIREADNFQLGVFTFEDT